MYWSSQLTNFPLPLILPNHLYLQLSFLVHQTIYVSSNLLNCIHSIYRIQIFLCEIWCYLMQLLFWIYLVIYSLLLINFSISFHRIVRFRLLLVQKVLLNEGKISTNLFRVTLVKIKWDYHSTTFLNKKLPLKINNKSTLAIKGDNKNEKINKNNSNNWKYLSPDFNDSTTFIYTGRPRHEYGKFLLEMIVGAESRLADKRPLMTWADHQRNGVNIWGLVSPDLNINVRPAALTPTAAAVRSYRPTRVSTTLGE